MRPKEIKWLAQGQRANSWWPSQNPASWFPVCGGFSYTRALPSWDGRPHVVTFAPPGCRCLWLAELAGVTRGPGRRVWRETDRGLPGWICTQSWSRSLCAGFCWEASSSVLCLLMSVLQPLHTALYQYTCIMYHACFASWCADKNQGLWQLSK